jgi:3'(2'), 5'-bisphosphate nucleotidase
VVEPVCGTKQFLRPNGEFTVNIALMDSNAPNFGIVYASVIDKLYYDARRPGAHKIDRKITTQVKAAPAEKTTLRTVASRSHQSQEESLECFIRAAEKREFVVVVMGSSLNFFPGAEKRADIYPVRPNNGLGHSCRPMRSRESYGLVAGLDCNSVKYNKPVPGNVGS